MSLLLNRDPLSPSGDFDGIFDDIPTPGGAGLVSTTSPIFGNASNFGEGLEGDDDLSLVQPKMDIQENPSSNSVTATMHLPGMSKEDIKVDVRNGHLFVSGETVQTQEYTEGGESEGGGVTVHREKHSGTFSRTIPVPSGTTPADVKAVMYDGVLTVTWPKEKTPGPTLSVTAEPEQPLIE